MAANRASLPPAKRAPPCYGPAVIAWAEDDARGPLDVAGLPFDPDAADGAAGETVLATKPRRSDDAPAAATARARAATAAPRGPPPGLFAAITATPLKKTLPPRRRNTVDLGCKGRISDSPRTALAAILNTRGAMPRRLD